MGGHDPGAGQHSAAGIDDNTTDLPGVGLRRRTSADRDQTGEE